MTRKPVLTTPLERYWSPHFAGRDVICGEVVINYEERVSTQGSDREKIEPKITTVGKESGVLRGWVERGKQTRKYGTFVSCPTVPWHSDTRHNSIIQSTGIKDTFALDMEASTFITVCEHLGVLSLGIIKGLGNPEASNSTAKAIEEWVKSYFEPTVTVGPTSHGQFVLLLYPCLHVDNILSHRI
jgi:hypothetical protein